LDCGSGGSAGIAVNIDTKNRTAIGAHKRILIQDNEIHGEPNQNGISISNAEDVQLLNNQIRDCQPAVFIQYSRKIRVIQQDNKKIDIGKGVSDLTINNVSSHQ